MRQSRVLFNFMLQKHRKR